MGKIAIEEHFLLPEFDDYFRTLIAGVPSESFDPVLPKFWDLDTGRLADMDLLGVERSILSYFNYGSVQLDPDAERAVQMARRMNDALAQRIALHPDRLSGFAALPLQDPDAAVGEFRRTVTELGFKGAMINGHTGGHYLDEAQYWPLWEAAAQLSVPIYLHPWSSPADQLKAYDGYPDILGPTWNWTVETATHALRIMCSGVFDAYPTAMMILGHMGELLPFCMERFDQGWQFYAAHKAKHSITHYLRTNVWITTSGNVSAVSLTGALSALGADRILFATDYPFDLGPAFLPTMENGILSTADLDKVYRGNAEQIFQLRGGG
ncbi:2,3-dihydroxybenzoate decarboxylase [Mycolicibacterium moriokaense]|uniref:2,3-dihydroxybenzoate decarboxylase n=2 Tax=Mycolicibacterium moriokaense TaxID=39691 RepID=A0A318HH02_9MYCO|nr:2,3-dihydroxybenzoate decarboxylase [Mycolicibacterium moriokaense]